MSRSRLTSGFWMPRLDGGGVPAPDDHGRAHLHGEGALLLEVREHRLQPLVQVRRVPVDDRALGQVREIALDLGQLAVEHQPGADHLARPLVEPAQVLRAPLRLDISPGRDLQWLADGQALDVRQMLLSADGPQGQAHAGRSSGWCVPMGTGAPALAPKPTAPCGAPRLAVGPAPGGGFAAPVATAPRGSCAVSPRRTGRRAPCRGRSRRAAGAEAEDQSRSVPASSPR